MAVELGPIDLGLAEMSQRFSAATVAGVMLRQGFRNTYMTGLKPLFSAAEDVRVFGRARTLSFLPMREDQSLPRERRHEAPHVRAFQSMEPGDVLVCDQRGVLTAGGLGNVVATYLKGKGVVGIVCDGALRDSKRLVKVGLPVYALGVHGASGVKEIWPVASDVPVACGGCLVIPGDYILGDGEGVVVIPRALVATVVEACLEQELSEEYTLEALGRGEDLADVYPPIGPYVADFEAFKRRRGNTP